MLVVAFFQQGGSSGSSLVFTLCVSLVALLVAAALLATAIRIVPEYRRLVVFRLGRCMGAVGPGLVFLLPLLDKDVSVDLRERAQTVLGEEATTQDHAAVKIDLFWSYKVVDPVQSVIAVKDLDGAAGEALSSVLRAAIGGMDYSDLLYQRAQLRERIRERLQAMMKPWGCQVENIEVREVRRGG